MKPLALFALAGFVGYLVDAGVLLIVSGYLDPYVGRVVSFGAAVFTTWLFNRSFTFRDRRRVGPIQREFALYALTTLGGGAVNFASYAVLVYTLDLSTYWLPLAVAFGSLAGMLVNYTLSRRFVFNGSVAAAEATAPTSIRRASTTPEGS